MRRDILWWVLGGSIVAYFIANRQKVIDLTTGPENIVSNTEDTISAALSGWKNVQQGPTWVPLLNSTELMYGLPTDLLARIAYQESHFRDDIIRGTKVSSAGALGIMQMMPQYFTSVNVPRPYTDGDVANQIDEAAKQLVSLYNSTHLWSLAIAAYNAGLGNVQKYGGIPPFTETQNYVQQIMADVPTISNA
ncbi:MAG: lytic transglycosylase domain-containing protein [Candidatus Dormibacteria bacterium]